MGPGLGLGVGSGVFGLGLGFGFGSGDMSYPYSLLKYSKTSKVIYISDFSWHMRFNNFNVYQIIMNKDEIEGKVKESRAKSVKR